MKVATPAAATPPAAPAPAAPAPDASSDLDFGDEAAPADDKPFDDEPFDAGVEADEDTDPKKFIEQLSGKIGQSLRKYTDEVGQPDFELEKFAINSLLSATHTAEMDEDDKKDIIKKVNTSGAGNDESPEMGDMSDENDSEMPDMGDENLQESEMTNIFLDGQGKRMSIFAPEGSPEFMEENRLDENLTGNEKNSIFGKDLLKAKLHETFNLKDMTETVEPIVQPIVKPTTTPAPSRRSKPFTIDPDSVPQTDPKAMNENLNRLDVYHNTFSSAVQTAGEYAKSKGYELNDDEWFNTIATGPKKPQEGETNKYTLTLYKNGKEQKKALHIQVYGMKNKYELNTYIA